MPNADDSPYDQISLLPEDWDEIEDGEIGLVGSTASTASESAEAYDG